jgi:hypothetical protein
MSKDLQPLESQFVTEVTAIILQAKQRAAVSINSELTLLYWQVGQRINQEVLGGERADYGKQVIVSLSKLLNAQFGRGWSQRNIEQMVKFANVFPDIGIAQPPCAPLSWGPFVIFCCFVVSIKSAF